MSLGASTQSLGKILALEKVNLGMLENESLLPWAYEQLGQLQLLKIYLYNFDRDDDWNYTIKDFYTHYDQNCDHDDDKDHKVKHLNN